MSHKLTDDLRDVVVAKAAAGMSLQSIADWIKATHRIDVNKSTLSRVVKSHRSDLANVSKGVVRAAIVPTLEAGIQALQARKARAQKIEEACAAVVLGAEVDDGEGGVIRTGGDVLSGVPMWAKANAELCRIEELELKAAGVDQPDDAMVDGLVGLLGLALDEEDKAARAAAFAGEEASADASDDEPSGGEQPAP